MRAKLIAAFLLFQLLAPLAAAGSPEGEIFVMRVADAIGPAVADHIRWGIRTAVAESGACLIIELDTPGGLAESMRDIVKEFFASPIPIVVYVSPSGARAASAGVMITMAADIAAMAPGTNIGAAHPVGSGGSKIEGPMADKVVNDMVAAAVSAAEKRGRNAEWVEKAIRESVSATETEALKKDVIDLVAADLDDLVAQINGRKIPDKGVLTLDPARRKVLEETLRTRILKTISDPNIAYILMMIGLAGLYFELAHPGAVLPGVIGGISIILAFFAFQTLPINTAGILLIALAIVFFILEMKVTSFGMLSLAGIVSLLLGSLMLFESGDSAVALSLKVLLPTVVLVSGFFVAVAALVFTAQTAKPMTGSAGLVGEVGVVRKVLAPEGKVFVHGELWRAVSATPIAEGRKVRVKKVANLVLEVEETEA